MTCPNCDMMLKHGTICTHCGLDFVLLKKTVRISNRMYNKGLSEAKSGNLSFAIDSLRKSISYNNNNTAARNLLGLVYYEIGRVADACREWITSASALKKNNPAIKYLDTLASDSVTFDEYCEAIVKYNNALSYLAKQNEDMAIIQIKRALELNPYFVDALNILSLCSIIKNDRDTARKTIEAALAIDVSNPIALRYFMEVNPNHSRYDATRRRPRQKRPQSFLYTKPKRMINVFHIASVLLFVTGIVSTALFFIFGVMPNTTDDLNDEIAALSRQLEIAAEQTDILLAEKDAEIISLTDTIEELRDRRDSMSEEYLRQDRVNTVETAYALSLEGKIEEAAKMLFNLDVSMLSLETKEKYDKMVYDTVFPAYTQSLYTNAQTRYNLSDYEGAKNFLTEAAAYATPGSVEMSNIIYYQGIIAQAEEDFALAIECFTTIIAEYPYASPNVISNSQDRLNVLEGL